MAKTKKKTQRQIIEARLNRYGYVQNVWAFQNYILRLGAIIHDLRQDGWDIITTYENKEGHRNCTYSLREHYEKENN